MKTRIEHKQIKHWGCKILIYIFIIFKLWHLVSSEAACKNNNKEFLFPKWNVTLILSAFLRMKVTLQTSNIHVNPNHSRLS